MSFKTDTVNDLDNTFFNENEFAEVISFNPDGGSPYDIKAIFDNAYEAVDPETEQPILSLNPTILIDENKILATIKPTDTVTVRNQIYKFTHNQPDGTGPIRILLTEKLP